MPRLTLLLDFSIQPYSIGDTILELAGAMAVADERGLSGLDVVAVAPRTGHADPNMAEAHRQPWESIGKLLPLLELARVASLAVCFDFAEAALPADYRRVWPPAGTGYATYEAIRQIADYHERHGHPPRLHFSEELCKWADSMIASCGRPVVTVNLRRQAHHQHRNADASVWADVMRRCSSQAQFVVIGERSEIDLGGLPVTFAKDHGSTLLQDLALVHRSGAHVGSPSGPCAVAMLGRAPYFFPAADMKPLLPLYEGTLREGGDGVLRYAFCAPNQRWSPEPESVDLLVEAIRSMVQR